MESYLIEIDDLPQLFVDIYNEFLYEHGYSNVNAVDYTLVELSRLITQSKKNKILIFGCALTKLQFKDLENIILDLIKINKRTPDKKEKIINIFNTLSKIIKEEYINNENITLNNQVQIEHELKKSDSVEKIVHDDEINQYNKKYYYEVLNVFIIRSKEFINSIYLNIDAYLEILRLMKKCYSLK